MYLDLDVSAGWILIALLALTWIARVLHHLIPVLMARYDGQAMRVAPPGEAAPSGHRNLTQREQAIWEGLQRWCLSGAGAGTRPIWRPWVPPRIPQPLSVARLAADDHPLSLCWLVERFSRRLDGSVALEELGGKLAGWRLRLQVKWDDGRWWRARQAGDPWDCGYLVNEPVARRALQQFRPRRATLLVAGGDWPEEALRGAIEALQQGSQQFRHPVRLLLIPAFTERGARPVEAGGVASDPAWRGLTCEICLIGDPRA